VAMSKQHILYVHWGCGNKAIHILDPGTKRKLVYISGAPGPMNQPAHGGKEKPCQIL
jgi:hypothetical protein